MKRPLPYLVAVAVAALLLSACGSGVDPDAVTVGPTTISRSTVDDELRALAGNEKFVDFFQQAQNIDITPMPNTLLPDVSSQWVNLLVNQTVVDREFERRNLELTDELRQQGRRDAEQTFGGAEVFAAFPQWFQDEMIDRQARVAALQRELPGFTPSEASLREYFDENMASSCITNQLVEHILVPTEAEAAAVAAELSQGADFGDVARSRSTDTGSAQLGGALWCTGSQELVDADKDFQAGVVTLQTGQTSAPVQSRFGYHIIRLVPWDFENVRPIVEQRYTQTVENPLTRLLNRSLRDTEVWVDPRYGQAVRTGGTVFVRPPTVPEPRDRPEPPVSPLPVQPGAPQPGAQQPQQQPVPTPTP